MINLFSLNQLSLKTNDKDNAKPYAESLLYAEVQPAFVKIFAKVRKKRNSNHIFTLQHVKKGANADEREIVP